MTSQALEVAGRSRWSLDIASRVQAGGPQGKCWCPEDCLPLGVSFGPSRGAYVSIGFVDGEDPELPPFFEAARDVGACPVPRPQELLTCPRDGAPGQGPVRSRRNPACRSLRSTVSGEMGSETEPPTTVGPSPENFERLLKTAAGTD